MIKDITIGQYYPTDSVIHRLDPRTKINTTLLFIIFLFIVNNIWGYLFAAVLVAVVTAVSKIPPGYVVRGLKPLIFIIALTVVINMFWTPGNVIWQWWIFKLTDAGLQNAVNMGFRLVLLVAGTSIMTLCTSTIALSDGMETLMKHIPLVRRVSHELSMMMSIALRFIPTLADETDRIMKAQKSRGADFESGNFISRAKSLIPILVPLFVSAFQRANELAMAMEARCYQGGENRTRLKELKYQRIDGSAYAIVFVCMGLLYATRYLPLLW
ncbi:MAG: energy-coupling factor transporter transmembrane protein EcfT [Anaerofustis sp.]